MLLRGIAWLCAGCIGGFSLAVYRHPSLSAYGLGVADETIPGIVAAIAGIAVVVALLPVLLDRATRRVWLKLPIGMLVSLPVSVVAILGIYALEFKYQKGESNLGKLEQFHHDLPAWKDRAKQLRQGILMATNLDRLPEPSPIQATLHSRRNHQGYSVENVVLETIPGFFLAGNLYRPLDIEAGTVRPVVVIPQGHFRDGRFGADMQHLAATFARMGTLAFLYDMAGRGETTQVNHEDPRALTLQLWNSKRVLDFLLGLSEADSTRVGMTGASGGGTQTFLCSAIDDRVTVTAPVAMVSSWVYGGCECESGLPIHRTKTYMSNNAEIAALTAPRPQLVVSIDSDWTRTVPLQEFPFIRSIYALFGPKLQIENKHITGEPHDYGPTKRDAVYRFFATHLNLPLDAVTLPDGRINETANTIEPREAMLSFDSEHPLPEHALKGWDDVMLVLFGKAR